MSLQRSYLRFLGSPKASALSKNATALNYVTTCHTVSGESIINHLSSQNHVLQRKTEKVLTGFETRDALVLEVETTIEFKTGGGAFLPGLDDNFLADQTATFILIHIVNFEDGLINQIRLYWDQGTLLKQMGVIGRTGRNWPIKDGLEQCKVVKSSTSSIVPSSSEDIPVTRNRGVSNASNSSSLSSIRPTPDPHSTLSLFAPREQEPDAEIKPAVIPPRNSAKPPPRNLWELFDPSAKDDGENEETILPKGQSQYQRGRGYDFLEGNQGDQPYDKGSVRSVKTNPKKYDHFEMSDEVPQSTTPPKVKETPRNKASWDFESFSTPEKVPGRVRPDGVRNFTLEDEEVTPVGKKPLTGAQNNANARRDALSHAKRDAESSITLADNSPIPRKQTTARELNADRKATLSNLDAHWGYEYESEQLGGGSRTIYKTRGDGMGGRKAVPVAEQTDEKKIYKTMGDGMGGRKVAENDVEKPVKAPRTLSKAKRAELAYDDDEENQESEVVELLGGGNRTIYQTKGDGMGGRKVFEDNEAPVKAPRTFSKAKQAELANQDDVETQAGRGKAELLGGGNRTIYKTTGDGMGGRKGASAPIWGFDGGEQDEKEKENHRQRKFRPDFQPSSEWDF